MEEQKVMKPLTAREKDVLDVMTKYIEQYNMQPTIREIARELGMSSPGNIHRIISNLKKKDYLDFGEKWHIGYPLLGAQSNVSGAASPEDSQAFLNEEERKVLDEIIRVKTETGVAPTIRELVNAVGIPGTGAIHRVLRSLEAKHYLELYPQEESGIALVPPKQDLYPVIVGRVPSSEKDFNIDQWNGVGRPNVIWLTLRYILEPFHAASAEQICIVEILDDSMVAEDIWKSDLVLVDRRKVAVDGDIVLASFQERVVLRILSLSSRRDLLVLKPATDYKDRTGKVNRFEEVVAKPEEIKIMGVAVGLVRRNLRQHRGSKERRSRRTQGS